MHLYWLTHRFDQRSSNGIGPKPRVADESDDSREGAWRLRRVQHGLNQVFSSRTQAETNCVARDNLFVPGSCRINQRRVGIDRELVAMDQFQDQGQRPWNRERVTLPDYPVFQVQFEQVV